MWLSKKSFVFNKLLQRVGAVANKKAGYESMAVLMRYETFSGRNKKDWRCRMLSVQSRVERERSTKAADCDCPDYHSLQDCLLFLVSHALLHVKSVGLSRYRWLSLLPSQALFPAFSLQRSRATCRHSSNLPYLLLPTFSSSGLARNRSRPVHSAFVSTNILLHLRAVFVSDHQIILVFI